MTSYNVDVVYTPMILADVFSQSWIARDMEFSTDGDEGPLVVQFAANTAKDLVNAAEFVSPFCNGVDINCGCPQKWAIKEGIGSALLDSPDLIRDMVYQVKRQINPSDFEGNFPCSIKIRIKNDLKETVELVKRAEAVGVDWITVHGRTRQQHSEPVSLEAIKLVKDVCHVPVFANGDILSLADAERVIQETGTNGVMIARGLLANPALLSGYEKTPIECVDKFIRLSLEHGSNHFIMHHHLMFMLDEQMSKTEKRHFNCLTSIPAILDFMELNYGLQY
jgi:tRNA-dihydrouridine synthase 4